MRCIVKCHRSNGVSDGVSENWCTAFQCLQTMVNALVSQPVQRGKPLHKLLCLEFLWQHRACVSFAVMLHLSTFVAEVWMFCILVYNCLHVTALCYLQHVIQPVTEVTLCRRLRSASSSAVVVPATRRSSLGDRAFVVAGTV